MTSTIPTPEGTSNGWRKSSRSASNASASCVEVRAWRKASRSQGNSACVEVGAADTQIAIRDSKFPAGGTLDLRAADWTSFLVDL